MVTTQPNTPSHVFVNAFARIHMGFLDLNGSQGRRFGSLGLGLNAPDTLIELAVGNQVFSQQEPKYIQLTKQRILKHANIQQEVSIKAHREIPRHFGLGSGTQMALAIGAGINQLFNLNLTLEEIATVTNRGLRSGIGIGTFAHGGLVLDGGRGDATINPPIILQQPFPSAWRVLLIFDHQHVGIHGNEEVAAFTSLDDASLAETQNVNYQVLMRALPALKEKNLKIFGSAVSALQAYTGDYFGPVQGGRYASQLVSEVLQYLSKQDIGCVGQSSWGPTGFAIVENETIANQYLEQLKSTFKQSELSWLVCEPRNTGATINDEINPYFHG